MVLYANLIVRNEAARIERCLESVALYVAGVVVLDTGSTDGTQQKILDFCNAKDLVCVLREGKFENFEQARNDALELARRNHTDADYHLLIDADMELVVEDDMCFSDLTGPSYDIEQKAGSLSYINRRLVRADQTGVYKGVTHEYLDVPSSGRVAGVHFLDHADGTNRSGKFKRDIDLLLEDLRNHPDNERSWYYLAQSYRDNGQPAEAAQAYRRRFEMGGWDEEVWSARVNYAHCLNTMGDEGGFVREMLAAYNFRPSRAEALYDLAKHFREKGDNTTSLLFSEPGLAVPRTTDALFVNDYVYQAGLKEEFSIAAFYDPARRDRGFKVTNELMLSKNAWGRELAKHNSFHYIQPLSRWVPSFKAHKIDIPLPDGYTPLNPSIVNRRGKLWTTVRSVNYTITADGRYEIRGGDGSITNDNPINTRNFIALLNNDLSVNFSSEVVWERPGAAFKQVIGLEDMRLFAIQDRMFFSACVREQNQEGWCEQLVGGLSFSEEQWNVSEWRILCPKDYPRQHEKNWMPFVAIDKPKFVYRLGTIVDGNIATRVVRRTATPMFVDTISGGSQVIAFGNGRIAVVHEARYRPDGTRYYQHRFAKFTETGDFAELSLPFVLHDKQIEFVAGLCWHPDRKRLLMSYGVRDEEAWVAEMDADEVAGMFQ